jgi:hypothetical protein
VPVCLVANVPERSGSLGLAAVGTIRRPLGREQHQGARCCCSRLYACYYNSTASIPISGTLSSAAAARELHFRSLTARLPGMTLPANGCG